MDLRPVFFILLLFILFLLSADQERKNRRKKLMQKVSGDVIPSPLSQGLTHLVGVAGGIYLSLLMLSSFLKITFPELISILGVEVDPLAVIALLLAIVQPWLIKIYNLLFND